MHPIDELIKTRAETMLDFVDGFVSTNCYAVYRADLNMTPGKLAAQTGHAFHSVIEHAMGNPSAVSDYRGTGHGTKIIMYVKNEGQLRRIYDEVVALGLFCAPVIDRGHVIPDSQFTGAPILTCVGFGPVNRDVVANVTKRCTMAR